MAGLAIFDLDRTLTTRGAFMPFVFHVLKRRPGRIVTAPRLLGAGALLGLKFAERDAVKALIWRKMLAGLDRDAAVALGDGFGRAWAAEALRRQAAAVVGRHKAAGDRLILATAAMDLIAAPFGRALGFDDIVATRTGWTAEGRVADRFDGLNCYGAEKLRRVLAALGPDADAAAATAYSDHVTDLPLLAWAGRGVAVNPHPPLAAAAAANGLAVADWDIAPAPGEV